MVDSILKLAVEDIRLLDPRKVPGLLDQHQFGSGDSEVYPPSLDRRANEVIVTNNDHGRDVYVSEAIQHTFPGKSI